MTRCSLLFAMFILALVGCRETTEPASAIRFTSVVAGSSHACALDASGVAYCWGSDSVAEQGFGPTRTDHAVATKVETNLRFRSLAAAGSRTCGIATDGGWYCWGYAALDNTFPLETPTAFETSRAWTSIAPGPLSHQCGISGGRAFCWGYDKLGSGLTGRLGLGPSVPQPVPTPQEVGSFAAIAVNPGNSCALDAGGRAYCWGILPPSLLEPGSPFTQCSDAGGRSGPQIFSCIFRPAPVLTSLRFTQLFAGICALTASGEAFCAQRGSGADTSFVMRRVFPDEPMRTLAVGDGDPQMCGISAAGRVFCSGLNNWGTLGGGVGTPTPFPETRSVASTLTFTSVAVGSHFACALTSEGEVFCWGRNDHGEIGTLEQLPPCPQNPAFVCALKPVRVEVRG